MTLKIFKRPFFHTAAAPTRQEGPGVGILQLHGLCGMPLAWPGRQDSEGLTNYQLQSWLASLDGIWGMWMTLPWPTHLDNGAYGFQAIL